jgi:hypothetical protein
MRTYSQILGYELTDASSIALGAPQTVGSMESCRMECDATPRCHAFSFRDTSCTLFSIDKACKGFTASPGSVLYLRSDEFSQSKCTECPADFFASEEGCMPCGLGATAMPGSFMCECDTLSGFTGSWSAPMGLGAPNGCQCAANSFYLIVDLALANDVPVQMVSCAPCGTGAVSTGADTRCECDISSGFSGSWSADGTTVCAPYDEARPSMEAASVAGATDAAALANSFDLEADASSSTAGTSGSEPLSLVTNILVGPTASSLTLPLEPPFSNTVFAYTAILQQPSTTFAFEVTTNAGSLSGAYRFSTEATPHAFALNAPVTVTIDPNQAGQTIYLSIYDSVIIHARARPSFSLLLLVAQFRSFVFSSWCSVCCALFACRV